MERKTLIIDDDVYCLGILKEYLADKNFAVTSFLSPACPMLEQNLDTCPMESPGYDIVISDYHMPEMTGFEFYEYQRQRGCKVPADHKALISGDISPQDQAIAESCGYKVFHKPTPLNLIDSWIDEVLSRKT